MNVSITDHLISLPHIVSDLSVGLECDDISEVLHQAHKLKDQAKMCMASMLEETAHNIEQNAAAGDLNGVRVLVSELNLRLQIVLASHRPL